MSPAKLLKSFSNCFSFEETEDARNALRLDQTEFLGRKLTVQVALRHYKDSLMTPYGKGYKMDNHYFQSGELGTSNKKEDSNQLSHYSSALSSNQVWQRGNSTETNAAAMQRDAANNKQASTDRGVLSGIISLNGNRNVAQYSPQDARSFSNQTKSIDKGVSTGSPEKRKGKWKRKGYTKETPRSNLISEKDHRKEKESDAEIFMAPILETGDGLTTKWEDTSTHCHNAPVSCISSPSNQKNLTANSTEDNATCIGDPQTPRKCSNVPENAKDMVRNNETDTCSKMVDAVPKCVFYFGTDKLLTAASETQVPKDSAKKNHGREGLQSTQSLASVTQNEELVERKDDALNPEAPVFQSPTERAKEPGNTVKIVKLPIENGHSPIELQMNENGSAPPNKECTAPTSDINSSGILKGLIANGEDGEDETGKIFEVAGSLAESRAAKIEREKDGSSSEGAESNGKIAALPATPQQPTRTPVPLAAKQTESIHPFARQNAAKKAQSKKGKPKKKEKARFAQDGKEIIGKDPPAPSDTDGQENSMTEKNGQSLANGAQTDGKPHCAPPRGHVNSAVESHEITKQPNPNGATTSPDPPSAALPPTPTKPAKVETTSAPGEVKAGSVSGTARVVPAIPVLNLAKVGRSSATSLATK